jgi:hypothetical protein
MKHRRCPGPKLWNFFASMLVARLVAFSKKKSRRKGLVRGFHFQCDSARDAPQPLYY